MSGPTLDQKDTTHGGFIMTRAYVGSEVGALRRVILHHRRRARPSHPEQYGRAPLRRHPGWSARRTSTTFAQALRDLDVEVLYLRDLLTQTMAEPLAREFVFDELIDAEVFGPAAIDPLMDVLSAMDALRPGERPHRRADQARDRRPPRLRAGLARARDAPRRGVRPRAAAQPTTSSRATPRAGSTAASRSARCTWSPGCASR